ncbi:acyltransferase family protein [Carboxylicivirga sp. RSCT41]|uniref:acyltransferase family protein n=1 Tax=Carboxylicivirga agarovorans TaxID=3417570 RepID=UPI003D33E626
MKESKRYLALDVLRGITIAGMILVNTPGSWSYIYAPLRHAAWHGCTPTDLVFPFFLFVMGVSMFFSFSKYGDGLNKASLVKIGKRGLLIFAIGLFLNSFPQWQTDFSRLRIMGVLQRIALAYVFSSLIVLSFKKRGIVISAVLLVLIHWLALYVFGGSEPYSLEQNATIPFDKAILGESHLYRGFGLPFDPEGIFSTMSAIATVLLGYLVGLLIKNSDRSKLPLKLLFNGGILVGAGLLWSLLLPLNKPLWTGSYVVYTAGLAMLLLSLLVWLVDIKGYKKWTSFFVVFGMNPLFIFAFSILWVKVLARIIKFSSIDGDVPTVMNGYTALYEGVFVPIAGNMNGSLLFALVHIVFFWSIGWVLYRKKIFIKV